MDQNIEKKEESNEEKREETKMESEIITIEENSKEVKKDEIETEKKVEIPSKMEENQDDAQNNEKIEKKEVTIKKQPKKKIKEKSKKPRNWFLTQDGLPSVNPVTNIYCIIVLLLIIFVFFLCIGLMFIFTNDDVVEVSANYGGNNNEPNHSCMMGTVEGGRPYCNITGIPIKIPAKMIPPIYIYYQLNGFYQNHRKYVSSKSDTQLAGTSLSKSEAESACGSKYLNVKDIYNETEVALATDADVISPCGLIAWSMFNDTFVLRSDEHPVCDTSFKGQLHNCTNEGIAWWSDVATKYKPQNSNVNVTQYPQFYPNEDGHVIPLVTDPDFIVWMRTAALPNFRKLLRIITVPLEAGTTLYLDVENNFPVHPFGGEKIFLLTTATVLGTKNWFLGIGYLVVCGASLFFAFVFFFWHVARSMYLKNKKNK